MATTLRIDWHTPGLFQSDDHKLVIEASALALPPGHWPVTIDVARNFGNGQPLVNVWRDAEVCVYKQRFGILQLHVLND